MSEHTCLCKHTSEETIRKAIQESGADTMDKVKLRTGAATGACNGERCKCKIHSMIKEHS